MTLTVRELLIAVDSGALKRLAEQPIPVTGAWRLRRVLRLLEAEYASAHAARMALFTDENSVPINGNQGRMVKPECVADFEASPLLTETVDIDAKPISVAHDLAGATITVADLGLIAPILSD